MTSLNPFISTGPGSEMPEYLRGFQDYFLTEENLRANKERNQNNTEISPETKKELDTLPELPTKPEPIEFGKDDFVLSEEIDPDIPKFKNKPSFDGYKGPTGFKIWLDRATSEDYGDGPLPPWHQMNTNQQRRYIYGLLNEAGLSDDDIYKAAQTAGITNVNSVSDANALIEAFNNNFYQDMKPGTNFYSGREIFDQYKEQGGKGKFKNVLADLGLDADNLNFDSRKEAKGFRNDLLEWAKGKGFFKSDGKGLGKFNKKLDNLFGGKFTYSNYEEALESMSPKKVNQYINEYSDLGGTVGSKVLDAVNPTYFNDNYGGMLLSKNKDKEWATKVVDRDKDGIDDRSQPGPGVPSFSGAFGERDLKNVKPYLRDKGFSKEQFLKKLQEAGVDFKDPILDKFDFLQDNNKKKDQPEPSSNDNDQILKKIVAPSLNSFGVKNFDSPNDAQVIFDWYKKQGGKGKKKKLISKAGIGSFNSESDAQDFLKYLTQKLNKKQGF